MNNKAPLLLALLYLATCSQVHKHESRAKIDPVAYTVLKDEMTTEVSITVPLSISEQQLRATLSKAADDHQYNEARDYLLSDRLVVEAYLKHEEKISTVPAGKVSRYVPPQHSASHSTTLETKILGEEDRFHLTLEKARRTLLRE